MTNPVESNVTDATKGHPFIIRSRIPAVTHAATASVAQIEFAASQNRQEVTKLDEKEADAATEIRSCTDLDEKLLMYRFTLVVTLIVVSNAPERIRLLAAVNDEVKSSGAALVYRLLKPLSFVAFKMGRLRGGPSRAGAKGAYLDRYVTDEQRSSRPIFNPTLRAAAKLKGFRRRYTRT